MSFAIRTILYATDLSENAEKSFGAALELARKHGAKIHILHVMTEMEGSVVGYVASVVGEEQMTEFELQHEADVREQLSGEIHHLIAQKTDGDQAFEDLVAAIQVQHGQPVSDILVYADRIDADLIVVGAHGKGRLHYTFLGSVAEKLLQQTNRPVLVVPLPPR